MFWIPDVTLVKGKRPLGGGRSLELGYYPHSTLVNLVHFGLYPLFLSDKGRGWSVGGDQHKVN